MNDSGSSTPPITQLLSSKGSNTLGHETNLSRSPIWQARRQPVDGDTVVSPLLYGHPFQKVEGQALTTHDQRLFAHFTTKYLRDGCPADRHVPFSLGEAALSLGHGDLGGKQRSLIRASLARLQSITIMSALRHPDGHETVLGWRLIDNFLVTTRGGGKGWITLNEAVALLLRDGSVTFLHAPTWHAICEEDEIAGRLWSFLESENVGGGWRYPLFSSETSGRGYLPSIADLLLLHWASRKEVAKRVRRACVVVEKRDPRYRLHLATGARPGSWILTCSRVADRRSSRASASEVPGVVLRAWRQAYRSHLPSARQRAVIVDVLTRRSPEWIVERLGEASDLPDGFRHVLDADSALSAHAITSARRAEEHWAEEKEHESSTAEQSLAELIGRVRAYAQPAASS
jgi:hypothetical protein